MTSMILWAEDLFHPCLPQNVQRAMRAASDLARQTGINGSAARVLVYFASLLDANDFRMAVFPRKSTVAHRLGISRATVCRCLNALESANLVRRDQQDRDRDTQKFEVGNIRFTDSAISKIEKHANPEKSENPEKPEQAAPEPSHTAVAPEHEDPAHPEAPCRSVLHGALSITDVKKSKRDAAFAKARFTPPADLAWLVSEEHLTSGQLVTLLAYARKANVWLQDVLDVRGHAIRNGGCRNAFAYLVKLIGSATDWAWCRKTQAQDVEATRRKEEGKQMVSHAASSFAGQVFRHDDGRTFAVWSTGTHCEVRDAAGVYLGVWPVDLAFVEAVADGRLRPA